MIISASRRTDIPAFYSSWLLNRLRAGSVWVRNPFNPNQVSQIVLDPRTVDGIVFWTKNPAPMLPQLAEIDRLGYHYYFQFTVTPYSQDLEPNVPAKAEVIATFRHLAQRLGPERVLWRFDPMILTPTCTATDHLQRFESLAAQLHGSTRCCTISFLTLYAKCQRNLRGIELLLPKEIAKRRLVEQLSAIARKYDIKLYACCDPLLQEQGGMAAARCIDDQVLAQILGQSLRVKKAAGQRPGCGCVVSIDIGAYNTCPHGCRYCYANVNAQVAASNYGAHDPDSPLLTGALTGCETLTRKPLFSCRSSQTRLF
jgi:hypothetical protein